MASDRNYSKTRFADGGSLMDKLSMKIGDSVDAVKKPFSKPAGYDAAMADYDSRNRAPVAPPAPAVASNDNSRTQIGGMNLSVNQRREQAAGLADGGDVAGDRAAAPGSGPSVSFWDRLKAGNVDDRGSEAYNRFNPKAAADFAQSDEKFKRSQAGASSSPAPSPAPAPATATADSGAYDFGGNTPSAPDASPAPAPTVARKPMRKAPTGPHPTPSLPTSSTASTGSAGSAEPPVTPDASSDAVSRRMASESPNATIPNLQARIDPNTLLPRYANGGSIGNGYGPTVKPATSYGKKK